MQASLRNKITIAFSLLIVIGGLIWFISDYRNHLLNQRLLIIDDKSKLLNTILEARRYEKNYFLYLDESNLDQALRYVEDIQIHLTAIIEEHGAYAVSKNLEDTLAELGDYQKLISRMLAIHKEKAESRDNQQLNAEYDRTQKEIRTLGQKITADVERMVQQEREHLNNLVHQSRIYLLILSIAVLILCITVALFLVFNVNRPLKSIEKAIQKIVSGDYSNIVLNAKSTEFSSLVDSLNNMINELGKRNEQLIQTEKMASLGTLTSGVAHELNNPLNNISTSIQIVLEELEEDNIEQKRELLVEVEKQIDRARDIVKALLEFSRKTSYNPRLTNLKHLVTKAIKLINVEIPTTVHINIDVPDDLRTVLDPLRIQQVLINLILNGVQAMAHGGTLTIKAAKEEAAQKVTIEVRDTGEGIPKEHLKKIFDPFYTTKDVGKGSGLGLSVSHGIIEQHGGQISVESEPGVQTAFFITLPAKPTVADKEKIGS